VADIATLAVGLLQAAKTVGGIGGVAPVLLPDVPLWTVAGFAALNPASIAVAFFLGKKLGQKQDQFGKILIAAFAGAIAGAALLWFGTLFRLSFLATAGRAAGGIFAAGCIASIGWAWLGYFFGTSKK
jgi:MFS family permease